MIAFATPRVKGVCVSCGQQFKPTKRHVICCSDLCAADRKRELRKQRHRESRLAAGLEIPPDRRWTETDLALLEVMASMYPSNQLVSKFNKQQDPSRPYRSWDSIRHACTFYKISFVPDSHYLRISRLVELTGFSSTTIRRWIKSGELKADTKTRAWTVRIKTLTEFLNKNPRIKSKIPAEKIAEINELYNASYFSIETFKRERNNNGQEA